MTQPPLPFLLDASGPRTHDMPPRWDGKPVQWRPWSDVGSVFVCSRGPGSRKPEPSCPCGAFGVVQMCSGLIDGTVALSATRCAACGTDTVVELGDDWPATSGPVWTLDWPEDYGDAGSVEP